MQLFPCQPSSQQRSTESCGIGRNTGCRLFNDSTRCAPLLPPRHALAALVQPGSNRRPSASSRQEKTTAHTISQEPKANEPSRAEPSREKLKPTTRTALEPTNNEASAANCSSTIPSLICFAGLLNTLTNIIRFYIHEASNPCQRGSFRGETNRRNKRLWFPSVQQ